MQKYTSLFLYLFFRKTLKKERMEYCFSSNFMLLIILLLLFQSTFSNNSIRVVFDHTLDLKKYFLLSPTIFFKPSILQYIFYYPIKLKKGCLSQTQKKYR